MYTRPGHFHLVHDGAHLGAGQYSWKHVEHRSRHSVAKLVDMMMAKMMQLPDMRHQSQPVAEEHTHDPFLILLGRNKRSAFCLRLRKNPVHSTNLEDLTGYD